MAIQDLFRKGESLFATTLSTGIGTGTGETITLESTSGLPTDTEITMTFNRVDANGTIQDPSAVERITGTISGSNLINYTRGTDDSTEQAHSAGTVIEYIFNSQDLNDMVDGILVNHDQDGGHSADAINAITEIASAIKSGADGKLVTGTAGTDTYVPQWNADGDLVDGYAFLDEDDMVSDSATSVASQQSIKKYVDDNAGGDVVDDTTPQLGGDLDVNGHNLTNSSAEHITITPGTNKLVKIAVLRQNDTTNAYKNDTIILTGWGEITAPADSNATDTVTFGVTFDDEPIVTMSFVGQGASGDFAGKSITSNDYRGFCIPNTISTTGFVGQMVNISGNWNSAGATAIYYTWMAIGELA